MIRVPYWLFITLLCIVTTALSFVALGYLFFVVKGYLDIYNPMWILITLFIAFGLPNVWRWLFSVYDHPDDETREGSRPPFSHKSAIIVGIIIFGAGALIYNYTLERIENNRGELWRDYVNGEIELTDEQFREAFGDLIDPAHVKRNSN